MKTKIVYRQSEFPDNAGTVFALLTQLKTLQYIAAPYASFTPLGGTDDIIWQPGRTFSFAFRLFCFIPFGTHTINVIRFDKEEIYTHESNTHVPIWNHRIRLIDNGNGTALYSDEVEIGAGWKTLFVWCWAELFYRHRQRKWLKLLNEQQRRVQS